MTIFRSKVDPRSADFSRNRAFMLGRVEAMRALEGRAIALSDKRQARFAERGQILPRERLARLVDPGLPFLELYNLANYLVEDANPETSIPGASTIIGIGYVSGVRTLIWVDDSGIRAGANTDGTLPKALGALDIALKQKLPVIHMVESAGANLLEYKVETWARYGGVFYRLAKLSAAGIPTITVLHGPATAGGAYMPGMSDHVVAVRDNAMAALAGGALVRAATGEVVDEAELGGGEMHAMVSGLVEHLAEDDDHAIAITRNLVASFDWHHHCPSPPAMAFAEPLSSPEELAGVVPDDPKVAYDVREVLCRILDGSDFDEHKARFGSATVCATGRVFGFPCGLIGNNGPIDPDGAAKATQFLQMCDQTQRPVVFLQNTTGYMVGTIYEQAGMIKHGSKMIQAVSNIRVPRITFYIGSSYGAGNYGMCGISYQPDFLFAWPNARTGVMGGEQAARTMSQVMALSAGRRGAAADTDDLRRQEEHLTQHFERQADAFYTSGRVLDNGVIDPRDTRTILGFLLQTCWESGHRTLNPNSFGIARI
ncbi:acyl-CoA carboxylase subunit beta [Sphingobium estronivorans]|uniref:acyl-CoA carboxylase subunit beta n=1 Tax=Sphingobium estronivorans TaxID=1577690 RepID=UPI001F07F80A|nr:carboxyl transferase domain-containing protein [Sphingobium estronivorans]